MHYVYNVKEHCTQDPNGVSLAAAFLTERHFNIITEIRKVSSPYPKYVSAADYAGGCHDGSEEMNSQKKTQGNWQKTEQREKSLIVKAEIFCQNLELHSRFQALTIQLWSANTTREMQALPGRFISLD